MTEADEFRATFSIVFNYTIPIKETAKTRDDEMGAGVLIEISGRLLVATAAHCIEKNPAVLEDTFELQAPSRVKILRGGLGENLDIGFLELGRDSDIPILNKGYVTLDMLSVQFPKPADMVHIVGFPAVARTLDGDRLTIQKKGFGTKLIEVDRTQPPLETLRFSFPTEGFSWDQQKNDWARVPFDKHPVGYSGGGVWSFTRPKEGELFTPQRYIRLHAIQSAWSKEGRYVRCIPIAYWLKGVSDSCPDLRAEIIKHFPIIGEASKYVSQPMPQT